MNDTMNTKFNLCEHSNEIYTIQHVIAMSCVLYIPRRGAYGSKCIRLVELASNRLNYSQCIVTELAVADSD